ncbi:hypothetical protein Tco_0853792 [Tanacetum coccineum]
MALPQEGKNKNICRRKETRIERVQPSKSPQKKRLSNDSANTYSSSTTKSGPSNTTPRNARAWRKIPLDSIDRSLRYRPGTHQRPRRRRESTDEEDLAEPWTCEDMDPFTPRIRNFRSSRKTRMPNNVKTYYGTGDPEDHLKVFQAATQVEHWAMPTWCHMFNSPNGLGIRAELRVWSRWSNPGKL